MLCPKCGAQLAGSKKVELCPQCQGVPAAPPRTASRESGKKTILIAAAAVTAFLLLTFVGALVIRARSAVSPAPHGAVSLPGQVQAAPAAADAPPAKASMFKVGVLLPLSGQLSEMGLAFKNGLDLFLKDNPGASSNLRFTFEDHKYEGKSTVTAFHKLRTVDKVNFVVVWGNTPSGACAPVAEKYKVSTLALTFDPHAKGRNHLITFGPRTDRQIQKVADQFKAWNAAVPGAVSVDMGNALLAVETLKKSLDRSLVVRTVAVQENDFMPTLLDLKQRQVDALLVFLTPEQALTFARQAAQIEYQPKVVGGDVFAKQEFREQVAQYLSEVRYVYGAVEENFIERLAKEQKTTSYFFEAASGYSIAALLHRVNGVRAVFPASDPMTVLQTVDRVGLPVKEVQLVKNEEYGTHFETGSAVYRTSGND